MFTDHGRRRFQSREMYFLEINEYVNKIIGKEKSDEWWREKNPLLGGQRPRKMVERGKGERLLEIIEACEDGNFP